MKLLRRRLPQAAGLVGQIRPSVTMLQAIRYALELFSRFPKETGHDPGLRQTGSLMVALTTERMDAYARQIERSHLNGIEADFVSHTEMARLAPELDVTKIEGGYFVPNDGYVDPQQCARAYAAAARDLGVQIQLNTPVTGFRQRNGEILGVETDSGFIASNHVVITAGPWGAGLAKASWHDRRRCNRFAINGLARCRLPASPTITLLCVSPMSVAI